MMIDRKHDPMGQAIADFHALGSAAKLRVLSPQFDEDEIPVPHLFRSFGEMPPLEQRALELCRGRVLDIGAGAGCHALELQQRGLEVTALDISPLACNTMCQRGLRDVRCEDVFSPAFEGSFDTILLLMNGMGIAGEADCLPTLLSRLRSLLAPNGQILTDNTDLRYIFEDEEGQLDWNPADGYYGEVEYQMRYKGIRGRTFPWLFADFNLLYRAAEQSGLVAERIVSGEHYNYLARLYLA